MRQQAEFPEFGYPMGIIVVGAGCFAGQRGVASGSDQGSRQQCQPRSFRSVHVYAAMVTLALKHTSDSDT
jgi:hypothetical protein